MNKASVSLAVLAVYLLAGCTGSTIYKQSKFGDIDVLSVDAKQRLVLQSKVGGRTFVCAEPSPDAIVAQAAHFASSGSVPLNGTTTANAQLAAGLSEAAASIAMRTQTIQLLRDGYFRLCEARMNGVISDRYYVYTLNFIDEFIVTVAAIEAIGGIVQTAPVAIYAQGSASAGQNAVVANNPAAPIVIPNITVNNGTVSDEKAKAIQGILDRYYRRKKEYQDWLLASG